MADQTQPHEGGTTNLSADRIRRAYETAKAALLAEMVSEPVAADDPVQKLLDAPVTELRHWVGELSTSALSTATAVMAFEQMRRQYVAAGREVPSEWLALIRGGIEWLIAHQNADGGWGDTVKSISNISTTMLCHAVLHAAQSSPVAPRQESRTRTEAANGTCVSNAASNVDGATAFVSRSDTATLAQAYIDRAGGVPALIARYGKDHTFSVPILTHCALAGLVDWSDVISLPFELACIPAKFYAAVRLPVVSYALPALIAIGQVRFHFRPSRNPLRRWLQRWAKPASLKVLERIQPTNGGFLEATPLTSFVTMSLAAMGLHDHPVAQKGIEFIVASARCEGARGWGLGLSELQTAVSNEVFLSSHQPLTPNPHPLCSWPIDTNLATWVTTLAVNALGDDVPLEARPGLRAWLLRQQYRVVHPYTNAAPGGWAWTDLPGGVPDGDDTPGAMLALRKLAHPDDWEAAAPHASQRAVTWLLSLQNRDGGWPTFCRGWGTLPFDRSSPDISAHCIRSLGEQWVSAFGGTLPEKLTINPKWQVGILNLFSRWQVSESIDAVWRGMTFLKRTQRPDGSWLPLWFGNQHAPNDENPTYGTAKVLAAFQALGRMSDESAVRGVRWLVENQNPDGGWGAGPGTPSSVEETALALEALLGACDSNSSPLPLGEGGRRPGEGREAFDAPTQTALRVNDGSNQTNSQSASTADRIPHPSPLPEGEGTGQCPSAVSRGLSWLIPRVEDGRFREAAPIGFYFAKLWYFEALYPLIFTVAALRKAAAMCGSDTTAVPRPLGSGPV